MLLWPNHEGIRLLSGTMRVKFPPAAPLLSRIIVVRPPVKRDGAGASPAWAANFGRQTDIWWPSANNSTDGGSMEDNLQAIVQVIFHVILFVVVHGNLVRNINLKQKLRKQKQSFKRKEGS